MVLIIGEEADVSTDNVVAWLTSKNIPIVRLNNPNIDIIKSANLDTEGLKIEFRDERINLSSIKGIWFRRGFLKGSNSVVKHASHSLAIQATAIAVRETEILRTFIYNKMPHINIVGNPAIYNVNKLESLLDAVHVGLNIPPSLITNNQESLRVFLLQHTSVLTKPLHENFILKEDSKEYGVGPSSIAKNCHPFSFSLFQHKIPRFCEIRTFFIDDEFYSMAIFVDAALDDARALTLSNNSARLVPYELPTDIIERLMKFNALKNLRTGSIDMILTKEGHYYFLEVNPVGQFDYLEFACNYPISRRIASKLSANEI